MPTTEKLWNATHPDFRMTIDGKRYVLRCVKGATVPVLLENAA